MKPDFFRVSFDQPILPRDRRRSRVAAVLLSVCGAGIVLSGIWALLNASSSTIGGFTNASPDQNIRVLGSMESGKSCEDQTWPYLEARCLKQADPQSPGRSTPKHGLGSDTVALPGAAGATDDKPASASAPHSGTTGTASGGEVGATALGRPVPSARPSEPGVASLGTDAARQRQDAKPGRSLRETRRQERARLQRERREAARMKRDARRARAETWDSDFQPQTDPRSRFSAERSYRLRDGSGRRVIVIRRGLLEDFF